MGERPTLAASAGPETAGDFFARLLRAARELVSEGTAALPGNQPGSFAPLELGHHHVVVLRDRGQAVPAHVRDHSGRSTVGTEADLLQLVLRDGEITCIAETASGFLERGASLGNEQQRGTAVIFPPGAMMEEFRRGSRTFGASSSPLRMRTGHRQG